MPYLAMLRRLLPGCTALLLLAGCSSIGSIMPWNGTSSTLTKKPDLAAKTPEELYNRGVDALNAKRYATAVTQFDAIEQNYPYSTWAAKAQLMHGYAEYLQNHYTEAIGALDRYVQLHPASADAAYAYYLRALCYYEQIEDVQRDQKGTDQAMAALQDVVNRFPDTPYARDARLKIDLCRDHLAGKEMVIGRWYESQRLYGAAINRYQRVIQLYQTTNHTPEALQRLVEVYLKLGMVQEAKSTAAVLGYNYPGSPWYQDAYAELADSGQVPPVRNGRAPTDRGFLARTFGSLL
jgi:outer membrane protein assembly factor BamD